jgi:hypothetical protein
MIRDEIAKKKNQLGKGYKKIIIKRMKTKFDIKIKLNKVSRQKKIKK